MGGGCAAALMRVCAVIRNRAQIGQCPWMEMDNGKLWYFALGHRYCNP